MRYPLHHDDSVTVKANTSVLQDSFFHPFPHLAVENAEEIHASAFKNSHFTVNSLYLLLLGACHSMCPLKYRVVRLTWTHPTCPERLRIMKCGLSSMKLRTGAITLRQITCDQFRHLPAITTMPPTPAALLGELRGRHDVRCFPWHHPPPPPKSWDCNVRGKFRLALRFNWPLRARGLSARVQANPSATSLPLQRPGASDAADAPLDCRTGNSSTVNVLYSFQLNKRNGNRALLSHLRTRSVWKLSPYDLQPSTWIHPREKVRRAVSSRQPAPAAKFQVPSSYSSVKRGVPAVTGLKEGHGGRAIGLPAHRGGASTPHLMATKAGLGVLPHSTSSQGRSQQGYVRLSLTNLLETGSDVKNKVETVHKLGCQLLKAANRKLKIANCGLYATLPFRWSLRSSYRSELCHSFTNQLHSWPGGLPRYLLCSLTISKVQHTPGSTENEEIVTRQSLYTVSSPGPSQEEAGLLRCEVRPCDEAGAVLLRLSRLQRERANAAILLVVKVENPSSGEAVLGKLQFVLGEYVYVDALGRLDVLITFPASLQSIIVAEMLENLPSATGVVEINEFKGMRVFKCRGWITITGTSVRADEGEARKLWSSAGMKGRWRSPRKPADQRLRLARFPHYSIRGRPRRESRQIRLGGRGRKENSIPASSGNLQIYYMKVNRSVYMGLFSRFETEARKRKGRTGFNPRPGHSRIVQVEIVLDDATGRRVFSGISRFPCRFILALLHKHLYSLIGSQDPSPSERGDLGGSEVLRTDEDDARRLWSSAGKREIPEKIGGIIRHDAHM
ncbi:hypothetical protein PR048_021747 [Dryococelus australis]|uniref:Uncharacterized protein n=1 Tax=Dryococelus australis TaxID=614101 RepID=A0ABQ9GZ34_9NEOP|nr:hypothetical protein PR048_021747 [Dryococelus australis]